MKTRIGSPLLSQLSHKDHLAFGAKSAFRGNRDALLREHQRNDELFLDSVASVKIGKRLNAFLSVIPERQLLDWHVVKSRPEGKQVGQRAGEGVFATTHWTVVLAAGKDPSARSDEALGKLCETYWYPLYAYVRRQGKAPEDAEDLTQQFFTRLLQKNYLANADPERGRFRTFLLSSLKHFLVNEWKRASRLKRGGGQSCISLNVEAAEERYAAEPTAEALPESLYERQWAVALIERVFETLRGEYGAADKGTLLEELKGFVWGEKNSASYAEIGGKLSLSEGTVKVSVHRLRQRFRELLREEVAQTVSQPQDIDGELRHLIAVLS